MRVSLPEYMLAYPTVFAVDDEYQIFIPFSDEVIVKIKVGDRWFYDDSNGILRSNIRIHKVSVPMEPLDQAREYTVAYRKMIQRKPYFPTSEEERCLTVPFRPVEGDELHLYMISDSHNLTAEPIKAASYFGDKLDLLVLNGDIPNHCGAVENYNTIFQIASGVTKGRCPVVFSRGNHDTRGIYAEEFARYTPNSNGRTYYSFRVGKLWGLVLDCGEDKTDDHAEYGYTTCFHDFRLRETEFLRELVCRGQQEYGAAGVKYRLVISHIPFTMLFPEPFNIEHDLYREWALLLKEKVKPQLMLHGHLHKNLLLEVGGPEDYLGQPCPVVVGCRPFGIGENEDGGEKHFIGCAITLSGQKAHVVFNHDSGQIIGETDISFQI